MDKDFALKTIRRVLHNFVTLKLTNNATLGQVSELLDTSTDELYRFFEDDLTQYRFMLEAMEGSSYYGPGGLTILVSDARKMRESFRTIRTALNDAKIPHAVGAIAEHVERVVKENAAHQQERFDFQEHGRMCEALEDAGFSPDADGLKALISQHKEAKREVDDVEERLNSHDPALRERWTPAGAVGILITRLRRKDELLRRIQTNAEEGLK